MVLPPCASMPRPDISQKSGARMNHVDTKVQVSAAAGRETVTDGALMTMTVVGCGDAFGSGGRGHTCFFLQDAESGALAVDFGASAMTGWSRLGLSTNVLDAVVISHLHGDHFGGLPFLLLECQYVSQRKRPLLLAGPPGMRARLDALCEAMFAGMSRTQWLFPWEVIEIQPGVAHKVAGFEIVSREVLHPSGAPSTCLRINGANGSFAYSGDTSWVDSLYQAACGADLFVVECYSGERAIPYHIDWPVLKSNLPALNAARIAVTHFGRTAFSHVQDMRDHGLIILEDGLKLDIAS